SSLLMSVRVRATWRAAAPGDCVLALEIGDEPPDAGVRAWDAPAIAPPPHWDGTQPIRGGGQGAQLPQGATGGGVARVRRPTWRKRLAPGERAEWDFLVPLYPMAPGARIPPRPHDAVVAEARTRWRERLGRTNVVRTGHLEYDALERASLITLLTCEERSGSH